MPGKVLLVLSALVLALSSVGLAAAQVASPNPVNFPNTIVGGTSAPVSVVFTNNQSVSINMFGSTLSDTTNFNLVSDGCSSPTIAPKQTCTVVVTFTPKSATTFNATLDIDFSCVDESCFGPTSVSLVGTGVLPVTPTSTPFPTPTLTPVPPTNTPASNPAQSEIGGTVFVDDQPVPGFTVTIDGRQTARTSTGSNGRYNFAGLAAGFYKVRVVYDKQKYSPVGQDFSDQTVSGTSVERRIDFHLKTLATTTPATTSVPSTTAAPTTAPVTTVPVTTPAVTSAPATTVPVDVKVTPPGATGGVQTARPIPQAMPSTGAGTTVTADESFLQALPGGLVVVSLLVLGLVLIRKFKTSRK